jgi:hypothetical protein
VFKVQTTSAFLAFVVVAINLAIWVWSIYFVYKVAKFVAAWPF